MMRLGSHCGRFALLALCVLVIAGCSGPQAALSAPGMVVTPDATSANQPVLSTPQSTATPTQAACAAAHGEVVDENVPSELLSQSLAVKIYLPPCYDQEREAAYPVLYMLHGQTYADDQWQRLGLLAAADEMTAAGEIVPMIIVMPYDLSWAAGPEESKFDEALVNELIPYVETHYNACSARACRALGGLSRGGNWAIYLAFTHPELFSAIGGHSAPLFYGEMQRVTAALKVPGAVEKLPAIYIDAGDKDEDLEQILDYVTLLKKNNVPYVFSEFMGYHNEEYWSAHVRDYLAWYSAQFAGLPQ